MALARFIQRRYDFYPALRCTQQSLVVGPELVITLNLSVVKYITCSAIR
jgi:hypothetical protein